jgi:hypothetical protein
MALKTAVKTQLYLQGVPLIFAELGMELIYRIIKDGMPFAVFARIPAVTIVADPTGSGQHGLPFGWIVADLSNGVRTKLGPGGDLPSTLRSNIPNSYASLKENHELTCLILGTDTAKFVSFNGFGLFNVNCDTTDRGGSNVRMTREDLRQMVQRVLEDLTTKSRFELSEKQLETEHLRRIVVIEDLMIWVSSPSETVYVNSEVKWRFVPTSDLVSMSSIQTTAEEERIETRSSATESGAAENPDK